MRKNNSKIYILKPGEYFSHREYYPRKHSNRRLQDLIRNRALSLILNKKYIVDNKPQTAIVKCSSEKIAYLFAPYYRRNSESCSCELLFLVHRYILNVRSNKNSMYVFLFERAIEIYASVGTRYERKVLGIHELSYFDNSPNFSEIEHVNIITITTEKKLINDIYEKITANITVDIESIDTYIINYMRSPIYSESISKKRIYILNRSIFHALLCTYIILYIFNIISINYINTYNISNSIKKNDFIQENSILEDELKNLNISRIKLDRNTSIYDILVNIKIIIEDRAAITSLFIDSNLVHLELVGEDPYNIYNLFKYSEYFHDVTIKQIKYDITASFILEFKYEK